MVANEIIVVPQDAFLAPVVNVANALSAYQAKKDLIEQILKENVDFGTIPGSAKPTPVEGRRGEDGQFLRPDHPLRGR